MHINFNGFGFNNGQVEELILEVQLGNEVVERQKILSVFAKHQFGQMVQNVANDPRPLKIKCIRYDYTDDGKEIENSLTFKNNVFLRNFEQEGEQNENNDE